MTHLINTAEHVTGISHPLVSDMYLKRSLNDNEHNVLVIEANVRGEEYDNDTEHDAFDSHLIDLLVDLEELKSMAEQRVGRFERVDIRTAS